MPRNKPFVFLNTNELRGNLVDKLLRRDLVLLRQLEAGQNIVKGPHNLHFVRLNRSLIQELGQQPQVLLPHRLIPRRLRAAVVEAAVTDGSLKYGVDDVKCRSKFSSYINVLFTTFVMEYCGYVDDL